MTTLLILLAYSAITSLVHAKIHGRIDLAVIASSRTRVNNGYLKPNLQAITDRFEIEEDKGKIAMLQANFQS